MDVSNLLHTNLNSPAFVVHCVLGGIVAALSTIVTTLAIENFGGVYGGVVGAIPTNIVVSCLGIALAADNDSEIQDAVFTIPIGMLVNVLFLMVWRVLPAFIPDGYSVREKLGVAAAFSATVWLLFAWVASEVLWRMHSWIELSGAVALLIMYVLGLHAAMGQRYAPRATERSSTTGLMTKGAIAGASVSISFLVVEVDDVFAGFASVFPYFAVYFITISGLWMSQGEHVPSGAVAPMMLASVSTGAYGLIFGLVETNMSGNTTATEVQSSLIAWTLTTLLFSLPVGVLLVAQQRNVISALGVISFSSGWTSSDGKRPSLSMAQAESDFDHDSVSKVI